VLRRQNELLRVTGLKLFSHFGVLPSGEILNDAGLDNFLSEQMFEEEFEFTVAEASSVGTSTLRCSLNRGEFRPFGIGKPIHLDTAASDKRVMRKMNTFNLGDNLHQVADFDPNFQNEKSQISSKASLPKGDQENSLSLFAQDDLPDNSPFKMRGFEDQGLFTGTTTTRSNRSIPNSSHQNRPSPNKKDLRFMGFNKIEKQPSVIKEEDPVDSMSAHHSSNGAPSKPQGSHHEPQLASELSKKSNSKTEPQTAGAVITNLNQIGKVSESRLFSDQSIKVKSKQSQTNDACPQPTVLEESQQQYIDSMANNDSDMNHSSIPHIRLSNTISDSSRLAIKHDESIVNCAELDRAEGIEMVLGYQTNLEPEAGPDTPIAGETNLQGVSDLENFSRFRSEKYPLNPQSYFEKQRSTEHPEQSDRLAKDPIGLFEAKTGFNRHIQSEIDEIENKIQLYKQREKQLDESLKVNHLSLVALRSPDQVQSEFVLENAHSKHPELLLQHKDEPRRPLPTILKTDEFNLLFGSMQSKDLEARKSHEAAEARQSPRVNKSATKFSVSSSQAQPQTPLSKIERITNELRNSIKRHSLNKTTFPSSEPLKEERSERVNLNNLTKIQPVKHFEVSRQAALQGPSKTSASKPPTPSNLQAHTKKSANSTHTSDFFKLSSQFGKHLGTPTKKKEKTQDFSLKTAIASKLENTTVSHVSKHLSFEPAKALVSKLIKSSHEIEVKRPNLQQPVPGPAEAQDARPAAKEDRSFQPKSKTVHRRDTLPSEEKTNSHVFLYSSANNPLKKHLKDPKLAQSTHNSSITSKLLKSAIDLRTEKAAFAIDFAAAKRSRQSVEPESPQPHTSKLASTVARKQRLAQASKANFSSALTHELSKTLHSTVPGVSDKMLQAVQKKYTANQPKKASIDYTAPIKRLPKQQ